METQQDRKKKSQRTKIHQQTHTAVHVDTCFQTVGISQDKILINVNYSCLCCKYEKNKKKDYSV